MVWKTSYNSGLGQQALSLAAVDVTPKVAIGTILKAFDDVFGEGEFIYLPGLTAALAGDAVTYDLLPGSQAIVRALTGTHANTGVPIAIALVAVPTGSYGWFQISGVGIVNVSAGAVAGRPFITATAGQLFSTAAAGTQVLNARLSSAIATPAAGQAYLTMNRPFVQGQIT